MSSTENQKGNKGPITLKIKFKSGSLEQFIERYSVDVSRGGIFIRTKEPLAVGTALKFEFQLQDGAPLLSGDGTVVWNRANDPARQNVAPGMGVRFDKLTPDAERVLSRILAEKDRRGDAQKGSRFDDGIRAQAGETTEAPAAATSQETPKGNMFGDEPTRAMAADQVNRLAESIKAGVIEEDQPTRRGTAADYSDEVRRITGASSEGSGSLPAIPSSSMPGAQKLPAMQPMQAIKKPDGLRSTLLGQGFGLGPSAPGGPGGPLVNPALANPALAAGREPSSSGIKAAQIPIPESAITPVKAADAAAVAESQRTPTGEAEAAQALAKPTPPAQAPSSPNEPAQAPASTPPAPDKPATPAIDSRPAAAIATPLAAASSGPSMQPVNTPAQGAAQSPTPSDSSAGPSAGGGGASKGLLIGAAILVTLVAAAAYFVLQGQKPVAPPPSTPPPPITNSAPPQPLQPPVLIPEKPPTPPTGDATKPAGTDNGKPGEAGKPGTEPADGTGQMLTTDPPGAQLEVAGKAIGATPVRVPGLTAGKIYDIKLTLQGFQEVRQKIKAGDASKPIEIKLQPVERQVEINSTPKGADVFVDGKRVGRTPWILRKIELSKPIKVELRRPGFEVWSHTVTDAESFQLRNKREVLTLNPTLEASAKKPVKAAPPAKKPAAAGDGGGATEPAKPDAKPDAKSDAKPEQKADEPAKPAEAKQAPPAEEPKAAAP